MGTIGDAFKAAWRDFVTDGIPATGENNPDKAEIRPIGNLIDQLVNGIAAGIQIVATTAARDTFYATAENQNKLVYVNNNNGSATDPANGVYEYVGGAARIAQGFYAGLIDAVEPYADAAAGSAASAAASASSIANDRATIDGLKTFTAQRVGVSGAPVGTGSTATPGNTFRFDDAATNAGDIGEFGIYARATGSIKIIVLSSSNAVVGTKTLTISSTGAQTFNAAAIGLSVPAGGRVALWSASGILGYTTNAWSGAGWSQFTGEYTGTGSFATGSNTNRLEAYFILRDAGVAAVSKSSQDAISARVTVNETAIDLLKTVTAAQVGRTVDPVDGSTIGAAVYLYEDVTTQSGYLNSVKVFVKATGTAYFCRYTYVGTTATLVAAYPVVLTATGLQTISFAAKAVPFAAGEHLGLFGPNMFTYTAAAADGTGWRQLNAGGSPPASGTVGSVNTAQRLQIQFNVSYVAQTVTAESFKAATGGGSITLSDVDKIAIVGNSYNDGGGWLLGKSNACLVSSLCEYNVANFSEGGRTAAQIAANITTAAIRYGATFAAHKATRAIYMETTNSKAASGGNQTDAAYYADVQTVLDVLKANGASPIIASEWGGTIAPTVDGEQRNVRGLRALADANGIPFFDVTSKSRTMSPGFYAPWWKSNHPVTRNTWMVINGYLRGIRQHLPRPRQSMKLFRVRGTTTVSSNADLLFRTLQERHRKFREIYIGHLALSEAQKVNYDTATGLYDGTVTQNDEYIALNAGTATSFGERALIDCVLPVTGAKGVKLTISDTAATVYARQMTSTGMAWVALTLTDGAFVVPDDAGLVDRDRIAFLVYKAGGLSLTASPKLAWTSGKVRYPAEPVPVSPPRGAEMLAQPLTVASGAVPAQWTNAGALPVVVPVDSVALPSGTTGCVEVTSAAGISQAVAYASSDDAAEVVVRVWARRFPAPFAAASDWSTAPINYETCDTGTLQVTLCGASGIANASAVLKEQVGLWWTEVEFRETLPALTTATTIDVRSADDTLQIAKVSVRTA